MPATKIASAASITLICAALSIRATTSFAQSATTRSRAYPPGPTATATAGAAQSSASATILGGQNPKVFYACYVPNSGVTYRIREVDLKQTCASEHVMFTWTDGGVPGPQGPQGDPGPQGAPGPKGDPGVSGFTTIDYVGGTVTTAQPGETGASSTAVCPAGSIAIGGGFVVLQYTGPAPIIKGSRREGVDKWIAFLSNASPGAGVAQFAAQAVCAK